MAWARRISGIIPHFYPIKFFVKWACSIVVIRRIRIAETRVRFSLGPPDRKLQARGSRLASLGDQIVKNFGRKKQLAIL